MSTSNELLVAIAILATVAVLLTSWCVVADHFRTGFLKLRRNSKKKQSPIKDGDRRCIKAYFQAVNSNSGRKTNGKGEI
jgi:hypothetical protein